MDTKGGQFYPKFQSYRALLYSIEYLEGDQVNADCRPSLSFKFSLIFSQQGVEERLERGHRPAHCQTLGQRQGLSINKF